MSRGSLLRWNSMLAILITVLLVTAAPHLRHGQTAQVVPNRIEVPVIQPITLPHIPTHAMLLSAHYLYGEHHVLSTGAWSEDWEGLCYVLTAMDESGNPVTQFEWKNMKVDIVSPVKAYSVDIRQDNCLEPRNMSDARTSSNGIYYLEVNVTRHDLALPKVLVFLLRLWSVDPKTLVVRYGQTVFEGERPW